jgi:hypothetical protein
MVVLAMKRWTCLITMAVLTLTPIECMVASGIPPSDPAPLFSTEALSAVSRWFRIGPFLSNTTSIFKNTKPPFVSLLPVIDWEEGYLQLWPHFASDPTLNHAPSRIRIKLPRAIHWPALSMTNSGTEGSSNPAFENSDAKDQEWAKDAAPGIAATLQLKPVNAGRALSKRLAGSIYSVALWGTPLIEKKRSVIQMARVGPLLFIDSLYFDRLSISVQQTLEGRVIKIDHFAQSPFSRNQTLQAVTISGLIALLHIDVKEKAVVDAGSVDAFLSLAALQRGAKKVFLIDVVKDPLVHKVLNLEINGWQRDAGIFTEGTYSVVQKDLRSAESVNDAANTLLVSPYDLVLLAGIGHPAHKRFWSQHTANNQAVLTLLNHISRKIVAIVASGYELAPDFMNEEPDIKFVRRKGFEVSRVFAIHISFR